MKLDDTDRRIVEMLQKDATLSYGEIAERLGITEREVEGRISCLLYTSPSPRDVEESRMPSSA